MIVLWIIAKSAVLPVIMVSKNKSYRNVYVTPPLKCKYSNNLRYCIFYFRELSALFIHQKKCLTLHLINQEYMKVLLFEISYKKKLVSLYFNCLRCNSIFYIYIYIYIYIRGGHRLIFLI